jgi:hypothetical protein
MKQTVAVSLTIAACVFARAVPAQDVEKPVPIVKAPYHRPVFTNQYVTLLDVYIPPGRNTGYHIHSQDSVSVSISPARQTNQVYGSVKVDPPGAGGEAGRVTFTPYYKDGTRTHKATNVDSIPFHNVSFLLNSRVPYKTTPSTRNVPGYTQIMDNERVRAWRVALEPGESTGRITQTAPGLRVVVHGGEIAELVPDTADRAWWLGDGQYFWQDQGVTRRVKNIGAARVEFVEFELK